MIKVLLVHQGYELYGSDRSFLEFATMLSLDSELDVTAIVPREGPLTHQLRKLNCKVEVMDLNVPRRSNGIAGILRNIALMPTSIIRAAIFSSRFDRVYINTLVIPSFMIATLLTGKKSFIHVREIATGPFRWLATIILFLSSRAVLIFNSSATQNAYSLAPWATRYVIHNGVDPTDLAYADISDDQAPKTKDSDKVRLLLIGRLNSWKGHDLLLSSILLLDPMLRKQLWIRFAGDSFEGDAVRNNILERIDELKSEVHDIEIIGFDPFPATHYTWADIVIVPSRKPEPFGRVAIEAMSFSKPVVAAAHGGLVEIVTDGVTGLLFKPNSAASLAEKLTTLLVQNQLQGHFGMRGRARYVDFFTKERCLTQLKQLLIS